MGERDTDDGDTLVFEAVLWRWTPQPPAKASWYFVTLTGDAADMVRMRSFERRAAGQSRGFGSVPVRATIGGSDFATSLFPHKESEGYLLPVKVEVRRREDIGEGDEVTVTLRL